MCETANVPNSLGGDGGGEGGISIYPLTLTLLTATQTLNIHHVTLSVMILIHQYNKFGTNRLYSSEDMEQKVLSE